MNDMNSNYCVCCGEEIPEGQQVCKSCMAKVFGADKVFTVDNRADDRTSPAAKP